MKNNSKHTDESVPQAVTGFIKLSTGQDAIQIGFTDQRVSGHAGLATFAGFLHWHRFGQQLTGWLPHRRTSPNALSAADLALGFVVGILAGASKLAKWHICGATCCWRRYWPLTASAANRASRGFSRGLPARAPTCVVLIARGTGVWTD
jgi:hypothetical protein